MTARFRSAGILVVLTLLLSVVVTQAHAAILVNFTGNTFPFGTDADGHVNFMVLDRIGAQTGDSWGTGITNFDSLFVAGVNGTTAAFSPNLDTGAAYLYLYQTVNDGTNSARIKTNSVAAREFHVTSWGHFNNVGFAWNNVLTSVANTYLSGVSAAPGNPSGVSVGGNSNSVNIDNLTIAPNRRIESNKFGSRLFSDRVSCW
jgi:hypothetical protein